MATKVRLALDWTPNVLHAGILVAKALKLDLLHGFELELVSPDKDNYIKTPARKLSLGEVELAVCPSEGIVAYQTSRHPAQLRALFALLDTDGSSIMCSKGIERPSDLAGQIYGSYNARYEDHIVQALVKADGGNTPMQIHRDVAKLDLFQALQDGTIKATWVFSPWEGVKAKQAGLDFKEFRLGDYGLVYGYSPVVAYRAASGLSDDQLESIGSALRQGYVYAQAHPRETIDLLAEAYPTESRRFWEASLEAVQQYWSADRRFGHMTLSKWSAFLAMLREHANLTEPLAPEDCYVDLACLRAPPEHEPDHAALTQATKRAPTADAQLLKRATHKNEAPSPTLLYVTKTTQLHPLLKRVREQLIAERQRKVTLIGMGAAVERTAFLALKCQEMLTSPNIGPDTPALTSTAPAAAATAGTATGQTVTQRARRDVVKLVTRVGTVELVDDLVPDDPDAERVTQVRRNSKIEIDLVVLSR